MKFEIRRKTPSGYTVNRRLDYTDAIFTLGQVVHDSGGTLDHTPLVAEPHWTEATYITLFPKGEDPFLGAVAVMTFDREGR